MKKSGKDCKSSISVSNKTPNLSPVKLINQKRNRPVDEQETVTFVDEFVKTSIPYKILKIENNNVKLFAFKGKAFVKVLDTLSDNPEKAFPRIDPNSSLLSVLIHMGIDFLKKDDSELFFQNTDQQSQIDWLKKKTKLGFEKLSIKLDSFADALYLLKTFTEDIVVCLFDNKDLVPQAACYKDFSYFPREIKGINFVTNYLLIRVKKLK